MDQLFKEKPKYYLKTLGDALEILDILSHVQVPMGVAELNREMGTGRSKIHRILDTLKYWSCVEQDPATRKYFLGSKVLELARNKLQTTDLIKVASTDLEELLEECQETVHLASLDNGQVLYLDKKQAPQAIGIISRVGQRLPAHCTGLGKVLLAHLDEKSLDEIIKGLGLPRFTENTITSESDLIEELLKIKESGFAIDNQEIEEGLCCVAAPIRNYLGEVIAAVSVSMPAFRFTEEKKRQIIEEIIIHAGRISKKLGYGFKK
ncbi:MAG: IclR family transcriptional regulator [Spirochaetes bacterium]|nr:IclR family transcriptional regulator [Spirochaetota bacterium]